MASFLHTTLYMLVISVASIHVYCSPIKRAATDQQATDCYGTDCYYSPDYYKTDTTVNVDFPENLTQVVLSILPLIPEKMEAHDQQIQNLTTVVAELLQRHLSALNGLEKSNKASGEVASETLTQIATTQNHTSNVLTQMASTQTQMASTQTQMASTQNHTSNVLTQMASTQTQMANSFSQVVNLLQMQSQQLQNMTDAMTKQNQILLLPDVSHPAPRDCSDLASRGNYPSGPYRIIPSYTFDVYCDMDTDGGGWTVFQRRFDGSVDFFLNWSDYETGFGSADGEYWAGLSLMHRMTQTGTWQLRIDLEAFDGDTAYALYDSFSIGSASTNYQLTIGAYSGTAGDSLGTYHNKMPFSTKDRDNDAWSADCASYSKGAWWYKYCAKVNLNALYLGPTGNSVTGNVWLKWKGWQALKKTEMKMRRVE